ncbi:cupin [Acetobacter persici]|uniref:cupin n=1 Tax=Acetobacter persici TaxID=1076596 RepID=UPI0036D86C36
MDKYSPKQSPVTLRDEDGPAITRDAEYFEYSTAANPIRPSLTPRIPFHFFSSALYVEGPSRVVPLDMSEALKCEAPATGPGLCANFVRIVAGDSLVMQPKSTSTVFYVIRGAGSVKAHGATFEWNEGDFFTAPGVSVIELKATGDAALYYVNDAPLLRYLGVEPSVAQFEPTLYRAEKANAELRIVASQPNAGEKSRVSILLGNANFPYTRTVTHVLWAMYGMIGAHTQQKPHRHQSIALDFIVDCDKGCYSLLSKEIDQDGNMVDPTRVDWETGSAFVTPPGYWHAHFNESDRDARLIPIQDAGLQTYLRTLDIRFT